MRQMTLVAFLQAQNCSTIPASWRHPQARPDCTSPDSYRHIGRILEAGKFDLGFFDGRMAMPDLYSDNHAHAVTNGMRCVQLDPLVVRMTMGMATERLGLGATYSTTYYAPFHSGVVYSARTIQAALYGIISVWHAPQSTTLKAPHAPLVHTLHDGS